MTDISRHDRDILRELRCISGALAGIAHVLHRLPKRGKPGKRRDEPAKSVLTPAKFDALAEGRDPTQITEDVTVAPRLGVGIFAVAGSRVYIGSQLTHPEALDTDDTWTEIVWIEAICG